MTRWGRSGGLDGGDTNLGIVVKRQGRVETSRSRTPARSFAWSPCAAPATVSLMSRLSTAGERTEVIRVYERCRRLPEVSLTSVTAALHRRLSG